MTDFQRLTESYSFKCAFVMHPESILMGNKAIILIKPQLLVNGRKASNEMLKNCKATLTTQNFVDGIPVTKSFDDLKVTDKTEVSVDFQVPPHLDHIKIKFEADVWNAS